MKNMVRGIDIKKGNKAELQVFRAIIQPKKVKKRIPFSKGSGYYDEQRAFRFPILNIGRGEKALYSSRKGKLWVESP